jgi:hypothetical protein
LPDIYSQALRKYEGREKLQRLVIPRLNCLWGDVVFLSPIDPRLLHNELHQRGIEVNPKTAFYRIPVTDLKLSCTVVYYDKREYGNGIPENAVEFLDPNIEFSISEETLEWYNQMALEKKLGFLFSGLAHVLVQASVSVERADIIRWGE